MGVGTTDRGNGDNNFQNTAVVTGTKVGIGVSMCSSTAVVGRLFLSTIITTARHMLANVV